MIGDENDDEKKVKPERREDDEPETLRDPMKPVSPDANPIDPRVFAPGGHDGRD